MVLSDADRALGKGKVIGLDYYYNHQVNNGVQFHYIWEDTANTGFSRFGDIWKQSGATLGQLHKAATLADLQKFSVYIIAVPTAASRSAPNPQNFILPPDIDAITAWVQSGGMLVMFANDKLNCEFDHYNHLATRFGITFNLDDRNESSAANRKPGTFMGDEFPNHPIFKDIKAVFANGICTLQVKDPAKPILVVPSETGNGKDIIMAESHFGKGLVFAMGDGWFYNEYFDSSWPNLPSENRKASANVCRWLLEAASAPQKP